MKKRALSLLMAVMMLVALVVPASATTDTSGTVTVYVTTGMFTTGGINEYPAYKGGTIYSNPNFSIMGYELNINTIATDYVSSTQLIYEAPESATTLKTPNILDAILAAFFDANVDIFSDVVAGWDANPVSGPAGGYINGVNPNYAVYDNPDTETINGVVYDKYSGQGWNIAYGMDLNNISAAEVYGTNVELVNGMVIIFDFSPYTIYEVHTDN